MFEQASEKRAVKVQADDPISFAQLVNKAEMGATEVIIWTQHLFWRWGGALEFSTIFNR